MTEVLSKTTVFEQPAVNDSKLEILNRKVGNRSWEFGTRN
jgi:hypothetical protein